MKKSHLLILLVSLFLSITSLNINSRGTQDTYDSQDGYVPNEVLVKFHKDIGRYFIQRAVDSVLGKVMTYLDEEISSLDWNPEISSLRSFLADPYLLHIKVPKEIGTEQAIYVQDVESKPKQTG